MRDLKECKAEIFRLSEQKNCILQKKRHKRRTAFKILSVCLFITAVALPVLYKKPFISNITSSSGTEGNGYGGFEGNGNNAVDSLPWPEVSDSLMEYSVPHYGDVSLNVEERPEPVYLLAKFSVGDETEKTRVYDKATANSVLAIIGKYMYIETPDAVVSDAEGPTDAIPPDITTTVDSVLTLFFYDGDSPEAIYEITKTAIVCEEFGLDIPITEKEYYDILSSISDLIE